MSGGQVHQQLQIYRGGGRGGAAVVASGGKHVAMPSCLGCSGEPTQYPDIATATAQEVQIHDTIDIDM